MECKCRPLNDEVLYTGDCPIHQAKMTISIESLKNSKNPEAIAILELIESEKRQALQSVLDKLDEQHKGYMKANNLNGASAIIDVQAIVEEMMK